MTATTEARTEQPGAGAPRTIGRFALAGVLLVAGVGHLVSTEEFRAQVPPFFPARDAIVYASGAIELLFGAALLAARGDRRLQTGFVVAAFFVAVFPGNISQLVTGEDAFGLDTDTKRAVRLVFQPLLVLWALWCTGALRHLRHRRHGR
jgi:uncharacterized membrane protein